MNRDVRVEPLLERLLAETPTSRAPDRLRADIASATSRKRQRPPWLTSLKEPPMRYRSQLVVGSPTLRLAAGRGRHGCPDPRPRRCRDRRRLAGAEPGPGPAGRPDMGHRPYPARPGLLQPGLRRRRRCQPPLELRSASRRHGRPVTHASRVRRWRGGTTTSTRRMKAPSRSSMEAEYLRNDGGGWACSDTNLDKGSGMYATGLTTGATYICVGEGGYAGLSAILVHKDAGGYDRGHRRSHLLRRPPAAAGGTGCSGVRPARAPRRHVGSLGPRAEGPAPAS